ncbi:MAG TPA: glucosamine-6-phosphate deaminase [Blastocatellia bacterium]|nr:glucosamine-6-phosphate deaminase [Blastocatellia bacterium]
MNILRFDSENSWVNGIASLWRDRLRLRPELKICAPSGQTPVRAFAAMARSVAAGEVSFSRAEIFLLDEFGGLDRDDAGRCENMVRRDLISHIDLPASHFHTINIDADDLNAVCRDYEAQIGAGFDLTILGIGTNGHLGMNEPGSAPDSTVRRVELADSTIQASARYVNGAQLPVWGVTVGLKQILASREVWVLANGVGKAEIIRRVIAGEADANVPASLLRDHPNCSFFLDAAAASLL